MKAKDLIKNARLAEAETPEGEAREQTPPPAGSTADRPGLPARPGMTRPGLMRRFPGMNRGGMPEQPSASGLSLADESKLKDVYLLILSEGMDNAFDGAIVRKLMAGEKLTQANWNHILAEARRLNGLPPSYQPVLEKIQALASAE